MVYIWTDAIDEELGVYDLENAIDDGEVIVGLDRGRLTMWEKSWRPKSSMRE